MIDYYWRFTVSYELFAFQGNDPEKKVILLSRTGSTELVTTNVKTTPQKEHSVFPNIDINIGWYDVFFKCLLTSFIIILIL